MVTPFIASKAWSYRKLAVTILKQQDLMIFSIKLLIRYGCSLNFKLIYVEILLNCVCHFYLLQMCNVIQFQRSSMNRYALHTLTPLTQIETKMYSSSNSSLTGIYNILYITINCYILLYKNVP